MTCKIRLLDDLKDTITLSKLLVGAGCAVLTVHGRTKEEKVVSSWMDVSLSLFLPLLTHINIIRVQDVVLLIGRLYLP